MTSLCYNSKRVELDCGTGAGGFKAGNTCAKGGGALPDVLGKKLTEKIKKQNPKADVAKEAVRMGVNAVVKAVRGAKIAGQYGASKTADIVRWLGSESGKSFLNAVGRTLKITGVGAIGALRGLRKDRFRILGTAIFAPQFVPFYAGASAFKGFFNGAIEEYNSEGSGRQISNAIRRSIGRPEFEAKTEDPKLEDVVAYLSDVLAVSIKDYIEGKEQFEVTTFADNCGTGSGGFKEGNTCAKGSQSGGIFISPSTEENQDFKSAKAKIDSGEQARAVSLSKDIIKDQGMRGEFKSAIGDWEDGAENAIKIEVQDAQDYDQIAYTAAKLGSMFKQKAVIAFQNKNDGQDSIYKISAPKGMDEMRKILSDNGIKFRTIFEDRGKSNVTIFDKGSELLSKINNVVEVANATGQIIKGVGEFIGGDTRIQGEQAYRKVISDYETKFPTRTRHRFSAGIGLHYNGSNYQLGDCGTGAGGFKEGNTCAKSGAGTTMTPSWARENPEKASKETAKTTTLFHGTSVDVLKSIKEKGLLPSKSGVWGGGKVYSTDSLDLAMEYGVLRATGAKAKIAGRTMIGIVSVLAEGFKSVADNIPTVKAQKMGKTGLTAVSKIFTKDGAVSPKSIRKIDIFDVDSIRKYVYENGPKPKALATKELEDGKKYIYVPIVIEIPEGEEDENLAYAIGGATMPATIKSAVIQGQGRKEELSNYTKPKLRERIKNRILRGTKGGKAGQWSARKAQLLVQAYEKAGGGYKGGKTKGQSSLKKWTKEKWRTSDNSKSIQRGKKTKRYLPSRVWDKLSPAEKATANRTKAQGSKKGKQFVPNPPSVTKKFSYNGDKIEFFDPSQPRDQSGKWTSTGAGTAGTIGTAISAIGKIANIKEKISGWLEENRGIYKYDKNPAHQEASEWAKSLAEKNIDPDRVDKIISTIQDYTGEGYGQLNFAHRKTGEIDKQSEKTKLLDEAINAGPKTDSNILYRGMKQEFEFEEGGINKVIPKKSGTEELAKNAKVGQVFEDKGFVSTSEKQYVGENFAGFNAVLGGSGSLQSTIEKYTGKPVQVIPFKDGAEIKSRDIRSRVFMEILGSKGKGVKVPSFATNIDENEVLLPRNSKFRVLEVQKMTLVPDIGSPKGVEKGYLAKIKVELL